MATSGTPWIIDKDTIITTLKEYKGVLTKSADKLKVAPHTLRLKIKQDPELVELLENLRNNFEETLLDEAENCLIYAMAQKGKDLGNALKSTFYILNNKGEARGYSAKNNPNNQNGPDAETIAKAIKDLERVSGTQEA